MPSIGICFRFYTQMRVQKKNKAFAYKTENSLHNSVCNDQQTYSNDSINGTGLITLQQSYWSMYLEGIKQQKILPISAYSARKVQSAAVHHILWSFFIN